MSIDEDTTKKSGYQRVGDRHRIFSTKMEEDLANYVKSLSNMFYGLSTNKCRQLAFEFAMQNNITIPDNWEKKRKAGIDWFLLFKFKYGLSVRKPEATSLARATAFNRHTVGNFFDQLGDLYDRYKFEMHDIYNLDKTGCTTVQQPGGVVAPTGKKRIGSVTSAEREELVTVLYAVGASGVVVPPMFVFPRVNFRNNFIVGGPLGCIGGANKSGWINEDLYVNFIKHFIHYVRSSKEQPVLLILDNVDAHISPTAIDLARENGVVMLTIPPHTSHYLQPLDRTCYGPFKTAFGVAMDEWMRSHPGCIVTIYDVPSLVAEAQLYSLTIRNIQNGFRVSGIHPYNKNVFTDEDFAPAEVTNCPDMGIVDCASDINDQQDPRIQNISDPDELSEKSLAIQLGKNLQTSNNQVPQVQVHITFRCVDLEKHFTKKRMSHLHRYCLSQKLLQ